jgi:hypothetical protein
MIEVSTLDHVSLDHLRVRVQRAKRIKEGSVSTWRPFPGPQEIALDSEADELFYGGAAGGGKSDLLLGTALTRHERSLILRREFTQLTGVGSLIERSRELIGPNGSYNGTYHTWRNLPGGRSIEFGGCQQYSDVFGYQGRPHDLIGFDEIAYFMESQYRFLKGWARTTTLGQRVRVIATGNPPTTPEGEWIIKYWAPWLDPGHSRPAKPGELRWFAVIDGEDVEVESGDPIKWQGDVIEPRSRTFIPAKLEDNPALMETGYRAQLQAMPEPLRTQMLFGDFDLKFEDDPWQVIKREWVEAAMERWTDKPPDLAQRALGVDCARGGGDEMIIAPVYGRWVAPMISIPGADVQDGDSAAALVSMRYEPSAVAYIDVVGIGSSVYDSCVRINIRSKAVNGGSGAPERATDKSGRLKFANYRAWIWWMVREDLEAGLLDLPPDRALKSDLTAPRYKVRGDKIVVEPKEDIIKRLGRSTDRGDALTYAWVPCRAGDQVEPYESVSQRRYSRRNRGRTM